MSVLSRCVAGRTILILVNAHKSSGLSITLTPTTRARFSHFRHILHHYYMKCWASVGARQSDNPVLRRTRLYSLCLSLRHVLPSNPHVIGIEICYVADISNGLLACKHSGILRHWQMISLQPVPVHSRAAQVSIFKRV